MPWTAVLLIGGALAIAGAPPFGVFISEFSIIAGAFAGHFWVLGALIAALLLLGFIPLVAPFHRMTFSNAETGGEVAQAELSAITLLPALVLLGAVLVHRRLDPGSPQSAAPPRRGGDDEMTTLRELAAPTRPCDRRERASGAADPVRSRRVPGRRLHARGRSCACGPLCRSLAAANPR